MLENGFILLDSPSFDFNKMISNLQQDWQITAQDITQQDDSLIFSVDGFLCAFAIIPAPIPNDEAVHRAKSNYLCPDAVAIAEVHKAHLIVTVMRQTNDSEIEGMKLYSKLIATAFNQDTATGVYTSGTTFSKSFYQSVTKQFLSNNDLPIMVWVFIGLGQTQDGNQLYTSGMTKFGKEEMEILDSQLDMQTLHASLISMCSYIISANITLKDGETVGFSAEQKWQINHSKSVYADSENSLKIGIA